MTMIVSKIGGIFIRLADIIRLLPARGLRIFAHLMDGSEKLSKLDLRAVKAADLGLSIGMWWIEMLVLLLDFLGMGELYEILMDWLKFNTRPLKSWERRLAYDIFGKALNYKRVRLDEWAFLGPPQFHICYVSGYVINSWGKMSNTTLIHELVHIWQYQNIGLTYIPRALRAQHSKEGYNYGGLERLKRYQKEGKTIFSFNLEQQAEIISDYYNLKNGYPLHYSQATYSDLAVYEYFVNQVRETYA
jgi:hypothetical protein